MFPRKLMAAGMNVRWTIPLGLVLAIAIGGVAATALRHAVANATPRPAAVHAGALHTATLPRHTSSAGRTSRVILRRLTPRERTARPVAEVVRLSGLLL